MYVLLKSILLTMISAICLGAFLAILAVCIAIFVEKSPCDFSFGASTVISFILSSGSSSFSTTFEIEFFTTLLICCLMFSTIFAIKLPYLSYKHMKIILSGFIIIYIQLIVNPYFSTFIVNINPYNICGYSYCKSSILSVIV